ncbi:hypothetical protein HD806DRAFT_331215 [Xylariaceae sp. AK1471]|nr:hypothetical protein HD806DRAFT_331215 [Xylariaceae sp. AK1471]
MGRWGMRLFEGDQDIDIALSINETFGDGQESLHLSRMVHQTDMLAPPEALLYYKTYEYARELDQLVVENRQKLDANGLGDRVMAHWRANESKIHGSYGGKYCVIIAGALLMRAGAKIKESDLQHLRELVPQINCNPGYALPLMDEGFRGPGKAQFLAALDNYQPGSPRSFQESSCFSCGKVKADVGNKPLQCARCEGAWYCNKDCQRGHWKAHKPSCIDPRKKILLNV